jgi:hypothetical protein
MPAASRVRNLVCLQERPPRRLVACPDRDASEARMPAFQTSSDYRRQPQRVMSAAAALERHYCVAADNAIPAGPAIMLSSST